ncbi:MAG: GFA family protein [Persicimonas sp.]
MVMKTHTGGCHCGRVCFEVRADLERAEILDCNCTICTKKGFLHLIVAPERFRLTSGGEALAEYRFNTKQAVHRFCKTCGIHPFYTPRSHPDDVDVNVRALDDVDISRLEIKPFDGRNWEQNVEEIQ